MLEKFLRVPWTARRSNQSLLKEISPKCSLEVLMLKLKLQYFGHLMRRADWFEKTLMLKRLKAGGEGDDRGWDGWMASQTRWTCVWVNSGSWWWTGRPAAAAKLLQSYPTLCDPIDGSPLGSSVPRILQARILEWVTISFSNAWKWKVKGKLLSVAWLLATPWTAAYQAPPSVDFFFFDVKKQCYDEMTIFVYMSFF